LKSFRDLVQSSLIQFLYIICKFITSPFYF
jgi:hypothetical protein